MISSCVSRHDAKREVRDDAERAQNDEPAAHTAQRRQ
jgi:hypothetical protein